MESKNKNWNIYHAKNIKRIRKTENRIKSKYVHSENNNHLGKILQLIYLKFATIQFCSFFKKEFYLKNLFKNKIYKICFEKDWNFFLQKKANLIFLSKKGQLQFDAISGEIINVLNLNNKISGKKNHFKISKNNNTLILFKYNLVLFDNKTKRKKKKLHVLFRIKFIIRKNIIYVLDNVGKFLIATINKNVINELIRVNPKNTRSINLKKIMYCNDILIITKPDRNRIFVYFLKKWKNSFFFRNPLFFSLRKLPNFMKFISIKKQLFIFLHFNILTLPIQIGINLSCKYENKSFSEVNHYKTITTLFMQNIYEDTCLFLIEGDTVKRVKFRKQYNKGLNLVFKKCKKKIILSTGIIDNCLKKIEDLFKYKLYQNTISENLFIGEFKNFLNNIKPITVNPLLTFILRLFFSFKEKALKNILLTVLIFQYHILTLKNNFFFLGSLSKLLKNHKLLEYELLLIRAYVLVSFGNFE